MEIVFQAILIGLIQGLTEFIPISSSAHLELTPWLLGWQEGGLVGSLSFDVFLHLGTLLALLGYFWRDWLRLIAAFIASLRERRIGPDPDRRLAWLLIGQPSRVGRFRLAGAVQFCPGASRSHTR